MTTDGTIDWYPWSAPIRRRKVRAVALTFVIVSVVFAVVILAIGRMDTGGWIPGTAQLPFALTFGLLSASISCTIVSWPLDDALKESLGLHREEKKAIRAAVMQRNGSSLPLHLRPRAATYAALTSQYLPFRTAQLTLLFSGVWIMQLSQYLNNASAELDGDGVLIALSALSTAVLVGFPVLLIVVLPVAVSRARRARFYFAEHASDRRLAPSSEDGAV